ncbi:MAG: glutamine-hydrolyzing GMP synthase [Candidatus Woesearchaeota archaeon]
MVVEKIVIIDFGSQYTNLILRRIKELGVHAEIVSPNDYFFAGKKYVKGIILSGSALSVYDKKSPKIDKKILNFDIPVLGICYGSQLIAYLEKGVVVRGEKGEYGKCSIKLIRSSVLFRGINKKFFVWMSHQDIIKELPKNYEVVALSENKIIAAFENKKKKIFAVQFHPEVVHTEFGVDILKNFVFNICGLKKTRIDYDLKQEIFDEIKRVLNGKKAIIGLSGGVDSSTAALMVNKVIGKNLICVFVDTGLVRKNDKEFLKREFSKYNLNFRIVNAKNRFLKALKGVKDPEKKRRIIGKLFVKIFEEIAVKEKAEFLIQGTIYSDRIESGLTRFSSKIKSHHNVGGLPKKTKLRIYEPLRNLYKDEVRKIAREIGLSDKIIKRHVFPGPGLAIRILGEVTEEKLSIIKKANFIVEEELKKSGFYDKVWMGFAVLLPVKSTGIKGDSRHYGYAVVLRIVESKDGMTANFSRIPYSVLERISTRITNEIKKVNRVVYDITNKPPATMEWE